MMVIGLHSGKEFFVQDHSFFIRVGDQVKQVFISEQGNRRIIVAESDIEFYDEPNTQEYLDQIHESIKATEARATSTKEGVEYV